MILTRSKTRLLSESESSIHDSIRLDSQVRINIPNSTQTLAASDINSVLGTNPWEYAFQCLLRKCGYRNKRYYKLGGLSRKGNAYAALCHGRRFEPFALRALSEKFGVTLEDSPVLNHPTLAFISGKPDATFLDENGYTIPIEVKCPEARYNLWENSQDEFHPQIQTYIQLLEAPYGYFVEYHPPKENVTGSIEQLFITKVDSDIDWWKEKVPILTSFWKELIHYKHLGIEHHPVMKCIKSWEMNLVNERSE